MYQFPKVLSLASVLAGLAVSSAEPRATGLSFKEDTSGQDWVVTWEFRREKYVRQVLEYDEAGLPRRIPRVAWRTIKVPVKRLIRTVG